jgi:hypothetical protein
MEALHDGRRHDIDRCLCMLHSKSGEVHTSSAIKYAVLRFALVQQDANLYPHPSLPSLMGHIAQRTVGVQIQGDSFWSSVLKCRWLLRTSILVEYNPTYLNSEGWQNLVPPLRRLQLLGLDVVYAVRPSDPVSHRTEAGHPGGV